MDVIKCRKVSINITIRKICLCDHLCFSVPMCNAYLCIHVSISLQLCMFLWLSVSLSVCMCDSLSVCVYTSLSLWLCLYDCLSVRQPEWFYTQILAWIRDHRDFLSNRIQPALDQTTSSPGQRDALVSASLPHTQNSHCFSVFCIDAYAINNGICINAQKSRHYAVFIFILHIIFFVFLVDLI